MISVFQHIEYLMMRHDCVVIPGWGALIAQYSSSRYDEERSLFECPQRRVGFNASVSHNDGLLAQSIVRREQVSYRQALQYIADTVAVIKRQLADGEEVAMGRLGVFMLNAEQRLEFRPFTRAQAVDDFYGLRTLRFKTLEQLRRERLATEREQQPAQVLPFVPAAGWQRRWRVAASIVALLALSLVLTTPVLLDDSNHHQAGLNVTSVKMPQRQHLDWSDVKADFSVTLPQTGEQVQEQAQVGESTRYYLIIASFRSLRQAEQFIAADAELGSRMRVIERGRYHSVYIATGDSYASLAAVSKQLPERYSQCWISD